MPAAGRAQEHAVLGGQPQLLAAVFQPWGTQLRWLIIAPLGNDVVPEV